MTLASASATSLAYPDPELQKMWQRKVDAQGTASQAAASADPAGTKPFLSLRDSLGKTDPTPKPAEILKKHHKGHGGPKPAQEAKNDGNIGPLPPLPATSPAAAATTADEFKLLFQGGPLPAQPAVSATAGPVTGDTSKIGMSKDPLPPQPVGSMPSTTAAGDKNAAMQPKPAEPLTAAQMILGKFQPANLDVMNLLGWPTAAAA